jgi:predicted ATPase
MLILSSIMIIWQLDIEASEISNEGLNKSVEDSGISTRSLLKRNNDGFKILSEWESGSNLNKGDSREPSIAAEGDKVYVVWHDFSDYNNCSNDCEVFYRHFDGSTWSDIQVISEPIFGQNKGSGGSGADIAVENGNVYVTWTGSANFLGEGDDLEIYFRCNLSGIGWGPIQVISEPMIGKNLNTGYSWQSRIAVDNGKVYIVWSDDNDTNNANSTEEDIFFRCNLTSTSWEPIQVISEPEFGKDINDGISWYPDIAADSYGVYVTWGDNFGYKGSSYTDWDIFYRSNLSGLGWGDIEVVSEPIQGINMNEDFSWSPKVAAENGNVYLLWEDTNNTNKSSSPQYNDFDIHYRCKPSGKSWGTILVVSEPIENTNMNIGDSWWKDIAVENGNVYVVWEDENQTFDSWKDLDIHYRCYIPGKGWGLIQVISEPVIGKNINKRTSDNPTIAVSSGKVHVAWFDSNDTDGSGTDNDIFYKQVIPISLIEPKVIPKFGNSSTFFNFSVRYYNNQNLASTEVSLNVCGTKYLMKETNPKDQNYLNGKKFYLNITHLEIGSHNVLFKAVCGGNTTHIPLTTSLIVLNTPPKLIISNSAVATEDIYFQMKDFYFDIDLKNINQIPIWNFSTNAEWLAFNSTSVILDGTPTNDDVGEYWVYLEVNDTYELDSKNFTISVSAVNDDPVINTTDIEIAFEDEQYYVNYNASDIDSPLRDQQWSFVTNTGTWLSLNQNSGVLKGIPTNDDVGEYWLNISVIDKAGGWDHSNFTLIVVNVNDPPEIITVNITTTVINEKYEVDYNASDVDTNSSKHRWSLSTNASNWLNIDPITGVLSGTPTSLGWYNVNISVSDGDGGSAWQKYILTVTNPNFPPNIITTDNLTAFVNMLYQNKYEAVDDRDNNLFWTILTNASWLDFYSATSTLYGTPSIQHIGSFWVNISVQDRENTVSFHNFTIRVYSSPGALKPKNKPPVLTDSKMIPAAGDTNTNFVFSVHYYDADSEPPTAIQVIINDVVFDMALQPSHSAVNGTYQYTTKLSEGKHTYYFSTSDGKDQVTTGEIVTGNIANAEEGAQSILGQYMIIWIIIFVLIISFLFIFSIFRSKTSKKRVDVEGAEASEPPGAGAHPSISIQKHKTSHSTPTKITPNVQQSPKSKQVQMKIKQKQTISVPAGIKLVGRDSELGRMLGHLTDATTGSGKTVFITGEAGIGKTRLVNELKQIAQSKSFYVLTGNSISESLTPFLPFREALTNGGLKHLLVEDVPRVEAVYLLTKDGLLVKEVIRKETKLNPDLFAAMLTTVSNFVKESLSTLLGESKEGKLNTLGYENYRILIESSANTNLVTIISGKENEFLIGDMRKIMEDLDKHYGYILGKWDGTAESIKGIDRLLNPLISSGKYDGVSIEAIGPRARRDMLFENITQGLVRQARTIPTMLVLEDLQWADPSSIALLYYIAKHIIDSRFLMVGTYRPEDVTSEKHPMNEMLQRMDREELYEELRLQRLPEESIPEFLVYLLGPTEFTDEFRHRIYSETDGNPLFIIQLIKFLVEEKNIVCSDDTWRLDSDKDLDKLDIPSKIYNVIARRLDRLDKEYRKVLDYASVIGDTFSSSILIDALKIDKVQVLENLRDLEKTHRLIHSFDGKFKFDHEKIKAVVYNELPAELKVEYHTIIGNTIENQFKNNLDDVTGELAFHYYNANNSEKVLHYLSLASDKARRNYANSEAIELYNKILDIETDPQNRIQTYETMGDIHYLMGDYDSSISSYSEGLKLASGNKKAELLAKLGGMLERKGDYDKSLESCRNALELVEGQNSKEEGLALQNLGNIYLFKKNYQKALENYEMSLKIRESIDDEPGIGACYNNIGLVYYGKKEYNKAIDYLEKSLMIREKLGDQEGIAATMNNIGATYQLLGDMNSAEYYYNESTEIKGKIGDTSSISVPIERFEK